MIMSSYYNSNINKSTGSKAITQVKSYQAYSKVAWEFPEVKDDEENLALKIFVLISDSTQLMQGRI